MPDLTQTCDTLLDNAIRQHQIPGIVAMVTDRKQNIYQAAKGYRRSGGDDEITLDTVFAMFSTTKAVAATAALQCVDDGLLDLDAPAAEYVPQIASLQVLDGYAPDGTPQFRDAKTQITTRMLLLHTAGFGYTNFNQDYARLADFHRLPPVASGKAQSLLTPLLFEPGTRWEYGCSIDWAGQVVAAIRGKRLGEVLRERIFDPLGMKDIAFTRNSSMKSRTMTMHRREADQSITPNDHFALPDNPEIDMGGHGLYASVPEYMKFIRMWLNDGRGPNGPILSPEIVEMAAQNGLPQGQKIKLLPAVNADNTNDAEFFPGMPKSWGISFMINDETAPTGRPAGSLAWAGLGNLYYWIDRKNGIGGFWASQILPFVDPHAVQSFYDFETATYAARI